MFSKIRDSFGMLLLVIGATGFAVFEIITVVLCFVESFWWGLFSLTPPGYLIAPFKVDTWQLCLSSLVVMAIGGIIKKSQF